LLKVLFDKISVPVLSNQCLVEFAMGYVSDAQRPLSRSLEKLPEAIVCHQLMQHVMTQSDLLKHRKTEGFTTTPWTSNEVVTSTVAQEGLNEEGLVNKSGGWVEEVLEQARGRDY
jgi:hypothetical protein